MSDTPLPPQGLRCPECGCRHLPVYMTRPEGARIRRVRACRHCGTRITTYESAPTAEKTGTVH